MSHGKDRHDLTNPPDEQPASVLDSLTGIPTGGEPGTEPEAPKDFTRAADAPPPPENPVEQGKSGKPARTRGQKPPPVPPVTRGGESELERLRRENAELRALQVTVSPFGAGPATTTPGLPTRRYFCRIPNDRTAPVITVDAVTPGDAIHEYKRAAGIISTIHEIAVSDADGS